MSQGTLHSLFLPGPIKVPLLIRPPLASPRPASSPVFTGGPPVVLNPNSGAFFAISTCRVPAGLAGPGPTGQVVGKGVGRAGWEDWRVKGRSGAWRQRRRWVYGGRDRSPGKGIRSGGARWGPTSGVCAGQPQSQEGRLRGSIHCGASCILSPHGPQKDTGWPQPRGLPWLV